MTKHNTTQPCIVQALNVSRFSTETFEYSTRCFMIHSRGSNKLHDPHSTAELKRRAYLATNLKSALIMLPTDFHADELVSGETQHANGAFVDTSWDRLNTSSRTYKRNALGGKGFGGNVFVAHGGFGGKIFAILLTSSFPVRFLF